MSDADRPTDEHTTIVPALGPPRVDPVESCLVSIHGDRVGRRYPLERPVVIGRVESADLVLDRPDVSRRHARLEPDGSGWVIRDLGSTNGTWVGETRVEEGRRLAHGDLINVGGVILKYISGDNIEALFHEEVYRASVFDGLTGIHNKRYLCEFLEREVARAVRHDRPLSLAMVDVDRFKEFNDTHGHLAGDSVLRGIAQRIDEMVRAEQLVARWGGEELAIVLPEQTLDEARTVCEKVRLRVSGEPFLAEGEPVRVTVSVGVAQVRPGDDVGSLTTSADRALYRAKAEGRDRVAVARR